jgi:hypothetical protein
MTSNTSGNLWAYGIIVALITFMSSTVFTVWYTSSTNVDLVYDDYYERTIGYDAHMERRDRGQMAEYKVNWSISTAKDTLYVAFPEGVVAGTLQLYRTSDQKLDRMYDLPQSAIPIADLMPGQWIIRAEWTLNDVPVYTEIPIWR